MRKQQKLNIVTPEGMWVLQQHSGNMRYSAYLQMQNSCGIACHIFAYKNAAVVNQTLVLDNAQINIGAQAAAVSNFLRETAEVAA